MSSTDDVRSGYTRRRFLSTLSIAAGTSASLLLSRNAAAADKPTKSKLSTYNGGTDPYPIPWLDGGDQLVRSVQPLPQAPAMIPIKGDS
jgi:hypothetical protein